MLRELRGNISSLLDRVGLLSRVFGRFKVMTSIDEKIARKGYALGGRLMQDLIGIRIAAYFLDDLPIVRDLLEGIFGHPVEEVKDAPSQTTFQPTRWNLVFRLPAHLQDEVLRVIQNKPIDTTFEVQLRTVLAEGWHEVEHDLRYKRPNDWSDELDMSRIFNGVLASLENADWTMLQLFDRLAYQKYKANKWESMLRMKYRIRLSGDLAPAISTTLNSRPDIAKYLFRARRNTVVRRLVAVGEDLPLTISNFTFLANRLTARDKSLIAQEPGPIARALQSYLHEAVDFDASGTFELNVPGRGSD
jgi:ppGpp synthetase/RelA/SpoT-type nucleotidyltranferase